MEACRKARLTRNQHVLFRLGELIAHAETAGSFARRAAAAADGTLPEKTDRRFDPPALAAMSRVFARSAAMRCAEDGLRWVMGAVPESGVDATTPASSLLEDLPLNAVRDAQTGLLRDLDAVADVLYGRRDT
jgi:alkylation response protein AidB-like acyl-CoA dehydrogenase